jgi:phosphoribosylanthranilate isomerase
MTPIVKICGLSTQATLDAALDAGADMVGFVFFPKSPRHIDWATARTLGRQAEGRAKIVALSVDANDDTLRRIVDALSPDLMQLHGSETPARVKEIGELFGRPTMKAIGVATRADLAGAEAYEGVADLLLIDAKPPKGAALPGGNGRPFDWDLTRDFRSSIPWLLSGGLDPDSVAAAIELSGARGVDVSSGVESAPGVKDPARIRSFVAAARRAFAREEIAFADAVHSPSADGRPSGRPLDRVSALRSPSKDGRSSERPFGRGYNPRQPGPEQRK